jgi:hypothetical protein
MKLTKSVTTKTDESLPVLTTAPAAAVMRRE